MSNIAISLASLVKNNKGLFKSEKQAQFLLSMCSDNEYYARNLANSTLVYLLDDKGVLKVTKITSKNTTVTFDRTINPNIAIAKKLKRLINGLHKSIEAREAEKDSYNTPELLEMYHDCEQIELNNLAHYEQQLRELEL